mmetsp:Transcript_93950/g.181256  ORF Transcript_93950/g.181256 Transcript_93950/m.181256 type:complete len:133 (-) Transcript_93950:45-443(-)
MRSTFLCLQIHIISVIFSIFCEALRLGLKIFQLIPYPIPPLIVMVVALPHDYIVVSHVQVETHVVSRVPRRFDPKRVGRLAGYRQFLRPGSGRKVWHRLAGILPPRSACRRAFFWILVWPAHPLVPDPPSPA